MSLLSLSLSLSPLLSLFIPPVPAAAKYPLSRNAFRKILPFVLGNLGLKREMIFFQNQGL